MFTKRSVAHQHPGCKASVMDKSNKMHQNSIFTAEPDQEGNVAKLKSTVKSEWLGVVRAEGRSQLLLDLLKEGVGTDDVENFVRVILC